MKLPKVHDHEVSHVPERFHNVASAHQIAVGDGLTLEVYYLTLISRVWTYVVISGERSCSLPYRFLGRVEPDMVKAEYEANVLGDR